MDVSKINSVRFYHGSPYRIEKFSTDFCGHGTDQNGSGFYVTNNRTIAIGYCSNNEEKQSTFGHLPEQPTLHIIKLKIESPLDVKEVKSLSSAQVEKFIKQSPSLDEALTNYGDVEWEGRGAVMSRAVESYANQGIPLIQTLHMIANDFFRGHVKEYNDFVINHLGYDSFIEKTGNDVIVTVLDEDKIEITSRKKLEHIRRNEASEGVSL